jgi:polysaccharide export outer membrane protein
MKIIIKKSVVYFKIGILFFAFSYLTSCVSSKKIIYFQDVINEDKKEILQNFEPTIEPDDLLSINITVLDAGAASPFNLNESTTGDTKDDKDQADGATYLVNSVGDIELPMLGVINVKGLTTRQLKDTLKFELQSKEFLKDPIITVRLINFKVNVLGEVGSPGTINVPSERITIVEALSQAGDLDIQGKRKNVLLIRENKGQRLYVNIDLTDKALFESPYYYLVQNDVIYVQPNKVKINSSGIGAGTGLIVGSVGILLALLNLLIR